MRLSVSLFGATLRLAISRATPAPNASHFTNNQQPRKYHTTASTDSCDNRQHDEILSCWRRRPRSPDRGPGHVASRHSWNVEHQVQQDAHWSGTKTCRAMHCCYTPVLTNPRRASTILSTTSSLSLSAPAFPTPSPRMATTRRHTIAPSRTRKTRHAPVALCSSSTASS